MNFQIVLDGFPQRFGEYQNISEEYVQSCIQKIKDINKEDER